MKDKYIYGRTGNMRAGGEGQKCEGRAGKGIRKAGE